MGKNADDKPRDDHDRARGKSKVVTHGMVAKGGKGALPKGMKGKRGGKRGR